MLREQIFWKFQLSGAICSSEALTQIIDTRRAAALLTRLRRRRTLGEYNICMSGRGLAHVMMRSLCLLLGILLCATIHVQHANSQQQSPQDQSTPGSNPAIPPGTILPVRLNSTLSSAKYRKGQAITARIMQDVPLPPGVRIKAGSKVLGHIVEVTPATTGAGARISLQFDKLVSSHQTISITTNLRAVAGFMEIIEAQTPTSGPGESDVFRWLTTVQVGGDVVYGEGGPVSTGEDANQIVGKAVYGGVLGKVRAKEGTKCRGAIDGNDSPQALWVFSSDACGTYGLEHISIAHAGRTDPTGVIVLISNRGGIKLPSGAGMLLRVSASRND
jgi:hypothetical protein